jgi:hypothetical protein
MSYRKILSIIPEKALEDLNPESSEITFYLTRYEIRDLFELS